MVGTNKCLLLDEPQTGEDVGYVIEPAHLSWEWQRRSSETETIRLMKLEHDLLFGLTGGLSEANTVSSKLSGTRMRPASSSVTSLSCYKEENGGS